MTIEFSLTKKNIFIFLAIGGLALVIFIASLLIHFLSNKVEGTVWQASEYQLILYEDSENALRRDLEMEGKSDEEFKAYLDTLLKDVKDMQIEFKKDYEVTVYNFKGYQSISGKYFNSYSTNPGEKTEPSKYYNEIRVVDEKTDAEYEIKFLKDSKCYYIEYEIVYGHSFKIIFEEIK